LGNKESSESNGLTDLLFAGLVIMAALVMLSRLVSALTGGSGISNDTSSLLGAFWRVVYGASVLFAVFVGVILVVRSVVSRKSLASRARFVLIPLSDWEPSLGVADAFARQLTRARPGWAFEFASAVRIGLLAVEGGRMATVVDVPEKSVKTLRAAVSSYGGVKMIPLSEMSREDPPGLPYSAIRELSLAGPSREPLSSPLWIGARSGSPLTSFAQIMGTVEEGDWAHVEVALVPAHPRHQRQQRERMEREGISAREVGEQKQLLALVAQRRELNQLNDKLDPSTPLYRAQVTVYAESSEEGRADSVVEQLCHAFAQWDGANHWRVSRSITRFLRWRQRYGLILAGLRWPFRRNYVSARELGALLAPATASCPAENVVRVEAGESEGGALKPYKKQKGVLPVPTLIGRKPGLAGIPIDATYFGAIAGRAGSGKTTVAELMALHLAFVEGHGFNFFDPHRNSALMLFDRLAATGRVTLIDAGDGGDTVFPGLNPISMVGVANDFENVSRKVQEVTSLLEQAVGVTSHHTNVMGTVGPIARALVELAAALPDEIQPTLFQLSTLVNNEEWRLQVASHLSPKMARFWGEGGDWERRRKQMNVGPFLTLLDRIERSPVLMSMLGSSRCDIDFRKLIDDRGILLVVPPPEQDGALLAKLLVYSIKRALLSRADGQSDNVPFWQILDEMPTFAAAAGTNIAATLRETRKFGGRLIGLFQDFAGLPAGLALPLLANATFISTGLLNSVDSRIIAPNLSPTFDYRAVGRLGRYEFWTRVGGGAAGGSTSLFRGRGLPVEAIWGKATAESATRTPGGRHPQVVMAELETLDDRILNHLASGAPRRLTAQEAEQARKLEAFRLVTLEKLSYREVADRIGNVTHTTVRRWVLEIRSDPERLRMVGEA
jgi:hypothetical protein